MNWLELEIPKQETHSLSGGMFPRLFELTVALLVTYECKWTRRADGQKWLSLTQRLFRLLVSYFLSMRDQTFHLIKNTCFPNFQLFPLVANLFSLVFLHCLWIETKQRSYTDRSGFRNGNTTFDINILGNPGGMYALLLRHLWFLVTRSVHTSLLDNWFHHG